MFLTSALTIALFALAALAWGSVGLFIRSWRDTIKYGPFEAEHYAATVFLFALATLLTAGSYTVSTYL